MTMLISHGLKQPRSTRTGLGSVEVLIYNLGGVSCRTARSLCLAKIDPLALSFFSAFRNQREGIDIAEP